MELEAKIESLLFAAERPIKLSELVKFMKEDKSTVSEALDQLADKYKQAGVVLLRQGETCMFATHPDNAELVAEFQNSELREKLTEAALETLAIIAYKQPVTRAEIESIRGVNSQYTLRLLHMRGLIERSKSPADGRAHVYKTTHEFLQHMGLTSPKELPDFEELTEEVKPPEEFDNTASHT